MGIHLVLFELNLYAASTVGRLSAGKAEQALELIRTLRQFGAGQRCNGKW